MTPSDCRTRQRPHDSIWLALLLLGPQVAGFAGAQQHDGGTSTRLVCESSGICSLGKVQPFTGDVMPPPSMRACLEARSYKKEVILLTETRLNPAFQAFRTLLSLGYEHVVLLSTEERCAKSTATWPRLACVWSSQAFVSNTKYLLDRVAFMTRAARLGHNALMLDSDVVLFRDVYLYLKAPPLANVSVMTMRDGNGWVNCGVVYVQNARPDGPAAYMLGEIVDRLERMGESPPFYSVRNLNAFCWDQQMYSDTLLTALAGRPVAYGCWFRNEPSARVQWDAAHQQLFGLQENGPLETRHYMQAERLPWPPEMLEHAPDYPNRHAAEVWTGQMTVPNTRGVWPPELGGAFYPPRRGPTSQDWIDILKADVLPLWPDPEDPSQADAAAAITELFAYLPIYLAESWSLGGAFGYWNPALLGPGVAPPVALAHFVHVPGGATNKMTVKMATNNWDWDVAHAVHPKRGVFFASTSAAPVPDVLALSREVEGREWPNEEAFAAATLALLRLGMEMGRAAAFPAPRCNVSWLGGEQNNKLPLQVHHGFHIPYSPAGKGFSDLRCLWGGHLQYGCQAVRSYFSGGLLAPEYDHLLDLIHQDNHSHGASARSAANLVQLGFVLDPLHMQTGSSIAGGDLDVVEVPLELLQPRPPATSWDVTELAAKLMERYGGPGSGLIQSNHSTSAAAGVAGSGSNSDGSSSRPVVLVLPEVPLLSDKQGPRHELFKRELETGSDRSVMSCDWIRTGRPYRRRRGARRRRLQASEGVRAGAP